MTSLDPYPLQAWTLLDAVNVCLRTIGTGAILMLDTANLNADGEDALKTVHDVSINLQQQGWAWNTEHGMVLSPHAQDSTPASGTVSLPFNTLRVISLNAQTGRNYIQRGLMLYDPYASTYNIGAAVTAELVVALDYEQMPQAGRAVVAMQAARIFAAGKLVNRLVDPFTQEEYDEALFRLYEAEDLSDDLTWTEKNMYLLRRHNRRFTG